MQSGLNNPEINLSPYIGVGQIELEADSRLDDQDLIHLGNLQFKVIHTPGHTAGATCLYCEKELPEFTQTHVHRVSDAIQPSHPLSSPSPPAPNPSQHQSLFQ